MEASLLGEKKIITLSSAEYEALSNAAKAMDIIYNITDDYTQPANVYSKTEIDSMLALKAALGSPSLTGIPTAPTAAAGTNTTQLATTAFVQTAIANAITSAIGGSY